jgi:hypothetical protein
MERIEAAGASPPVSQDPPASSLAGRLGIVFYHLVALVVTVGDVPFVASAVLHRAGAVLIVLVPVPAFAILAELVIHFLGHGWASAGHGTAGY